MALARNARRSLARADGPILIAVEDGHLTVETWGRAWLRRGSDGISVDPGEQGMVRNDGLLMHQGGLATVQIAGDGPAVVHVLTLRPLETPVVRFFSADKHVKRAAIAIVHPGACHIGSTWAVACYPPETLTLAAAGSMPIRSER